MKPKTTPTPDAPKNQGEGNREAARRFNEDQQRFVESGKVPKAAKEAAPNNAAEASELERAEQVGRSHAKGEDPTVPGANAAVNANAPAKARAKPTPARR